MIIEIIAALCTGIVINYVWYFTCYETRIGYPLMTCNMLINFGIVKTWQIPLIILFMLVYTYWPVVVVSGWMMKLLGVF